MSTQKVLSLWTDRNYMRFYFVAILTFLLGTAAVAQGSTYKTITAVQADTLIRNHQSSSDFVILDVRTSAEFINERIDKARNLDVNVAYFNDSIDKLDKNKIYFLYCGSNSRSSGACTKMIARNIKTVYNLQGGISAWKSAGFPTIRGSGTGVDNNSVSVLIVKIYPNPVVDLSTLEIDGFLEGEVKIEILNALGSLVLSQKMVPGRAITLNGRELSPGLYFYRLVLPQNQVKSGRFQVAR
ncbi:MAG: T9SS C-terminal target domain-containing protein [Porphyromonadaceae bacterium]|nr:MAG: T9SS C-terminal target domain-containing protein [Porphyromonadaceae bacterium]